MLGRIARYAVTVAITLVLVTVGSACVYLRADLSPAQGRLLLPELRAPVEVIRDRWGVPHIYAQGEHDLFFAQGYVQAQDRLWQMELGRRSAQGTLAEVLGESALAADRVARTLGFARGAQAEWHMLDPETRAALEAYTRGVNAFLAAADRQPPVEFRLLGLTPAPWQPVDTLAWARLLAWSQDTGWEGDVLRARLVRKLGRERTVQLEPDIAGLVPSSGVEDALAAFDAPLLLEDVGEAWPWARWLKGDDKCWIVDGARSASGRPILAADLHAPTQMPSLWYVMHLSGGAYDVAGATIPGVPGVVVGRNRTLAWGRFDAGADAEDLYVEHLRYAGDRLQAEADGRWEDLRLLQETIHVRGRPEPEAHTVYLTRHGPLITVPAPDRPYQVALRWAGDGQPTGYARCLPALNRAVSRQEFTAALRNWAVPSQGLACVDDQGQSGYATPGMARVSAGREAGGFPLAGWSAARECRGVPSPEAPAGPAATTVNGPSAIAPDSLAAMGRLRAPEGGGSYRIGQAGSLPEAKDKLSVADVWAMQMDLQGPEPRLLSLLRALGPQDWLQARTLPLLQQWDLHYDAESVGAGVYETFYWRLVHDTLDDDLGAPLVDAYLNLSTGQRAVMDALSAQPTNAWFDDTRTPQRETRDDIVRRSFAEALEWLGRRFGDLPYEWNWGRVHNVTFRHALGRQWPLTVLLNRGAMRLSGGPECTMTTRMDYGAMMVVRAAPTYRMVVEPGEDGQALIMGATGQSGGPLSAHYADLIKPWQGGRCHLLLTERQAVVRAKAGWLTLAPES